jgi:hypothetical protein
MEAPTTYTSPVPEEPSPQSRRQDAPRNRQGSSMKAQIQALSDKVTAHEDVIRRLGIAFASLSMFQDHGSVHHTGPQSHTESYGQGRGHSSQYRYTGPSHAESYGEGRGHSSHYHSSPSSFSGRGRRGRGGVSG